MIIDQRLHAAGQLTNATLDTLLSRVDALRADARWSTLHKIRDDAERAAAWKAFRAEYDLEGSRDAVNTAHAHWKASQWMPSVISNVIALSVGLDVWPRVNEYLLGKKGRPRFTKSAEHDTVWGRSQTEGLRSNAAGDGILWPSRTQRKSIELKFELNAASNQYQKRIAGRQIKRVGVTRKIIRGKAKFYALLTIAGKPYRDPVLLKEVRSSSKQGPAVIDMGPSTCAGSSLAASVLVDLAPAKRLKQMKHQARNLKRDQRKQDRSLRAMNPETYEGTHASGAKKSHGEGKSVKGMKKAKRSRAYERRQAALKEQERHLAAQKRAGESELARTLVRVLGAHMGTEDLSLVAWQKRWGRRIGLTAPGSFRAAVGRECQRHGGELTLLNATALTLSQGCLCGARARKPLSQRIHSCERGLTGLDRDLFSSFLGAYCMQHSVETFEGSEAFPASPSTRTKASRLCDRENALRLVAGGSPSIARSSRSVDCSRVKPENAQAGSISRELEASARPPWERARTQLASPDHSARGNPPDF
jgi:putative transposase